LVRLFVALDFPENVRQNLRESIAPLKSEFAKVKWVRPEGMHVTLKFIGYVDDKKVESIAAALKDVHSPHPVELTFRGVGFFPNERSPRVAWCGVEVSSNLTELAAEIERALEPLGIEAESRPYFPHLTVARLPSSSKGADKLVYAANQLKSRNFGTTRESEFYLYESILKPSGAEYNRLQGYPFVKGAV
jgi:RNA 2',3'-cyclic 3'-phosphodiesterase